MQRLKLDFMTDGIRTHVHQAQRRQRKINNILFHTATITYTTQFYEWYHENLHTYQTIKHTNTTRRTKTTKSTWVTLLTQRLCSYNWDSSNSGVFIFKLCNKSVYFVHFIYHQFLYILWSSKIMLLARWAIS